MDLSISKMAIEGTVGISSMDRKPNKPMEIFGRYYTLAIEIAVAVLVPILIGRWLDGKTGKEPWFTIIGMILGGAAAMRSAHRVYTEMLRSPDKDATKNKRPEEKQKK